MNLKNNTILITGATSGIGRALAEAFHKLGNTVIIAGRRQALLDEITAKHSGMRGLKVDLENPASIAEFAAKVRQEFPQLNVLINNAGISQMESLVDGNTDLSVSQAIIDTNIGSVLHLTAELLPLLRSQPSATMITTTSNLAFLPRAAFPTYCASKAFLHSWLQSLRFQLRETSVEILELAPPYVRTELTGPAQTTDPRAMPLDEYVSEVMQLLAEPNPPRGEIIVGRGSELRWAERDNVYEATYTTVNTR